MSKRTETNLGLTYGWKPGDGSGAAQTPNWHIVAGLLQASVVNIVDEPPMGFGLDDKYLVSETPSGAFTGYANHIAWNDNGTWRFFPPKPGYHAYVQYEERGATFKSGAWVLDGSSDTAKSLVTVSRVNADSVVLTKGMVLCVNGGQFKRARADDYTLSQVIGLVFDDSILIGGSGRACTSGVVSQDAVDWDAITGGSGGLVVDQTYFMSVVDGQLSTASPPDVTGNVVYPIGTALSPTDFLVELGTPIDL